MWQTVHSITTVLFVSLWATEWIVYWPHRLTIYNTFTHIHACTYTFLHTHTHMAVHMHTHTHGCSHAHTPQTYTHMQFRLGGESQIVSANKYGVLWFKGKELNMVFGLLFCLPWIVRLHSHPSNCNAYACDLTSLIIWPRIWTWVHKDICCRVTMLWCNNALHM